MLSSLLPGGSVLIIWLGSAVAADMIASFALCPMEATRIRLVADPNFAHGTFDGISRVRWWRGLGGGVGM
jgi:solute carrier family 25 (mitochondrial phosphate transporter), member 3